MALTSPVALSQKLRIPNGELMWQLLDYAWLPDPAGNRSVLDNVSSMTDFRSDWAGSEADPISPPAESIRQIPNPLEHDNPPYNFLHAYLGDDMGGVWEQILGNNEVGGQNFWNAPF